MNVITAYPITVEKRKNAIWRMSSFEGARYNNTDGIKVIRAFQWFVNFSYSLAQLPLNGKWDEATKKYEPRFGAAFDKVLAKHPNIIQKINDRIEGVPTSKGGTSLESMLGSAPTALPSGTASQPIPEPTAEEKLKAEKQGKRWDATKKAWLFIQDSSLAQTGTDWLRQKLGLAPNAPSYGGTTDFGFGQSTLTPNTLCPEGFEMQPDGSCKKKGMSTGMKIGIAVGAVAVIGLIIYLVKTSKNK